MLKKSITYTDYNGKETTEDFYFNLTKAEMVEMEFGIQGGLKEHLTRIVEAQDGKEIMAAMKNLILGAYGKRSEDGKRFIKNEHIREEFASSEAYSELFIEMCTKADVAAEFMNSIIPRNLEDVNQTQLAVDRPNLTQVQNRYPDGVEVRSEPRKLTQQEVVDMDNDELKSGLATGKYTL